MSLPTENPFAIASRRSPKVSARRLLAASKGLGLVGLLLAVLIVAQTQTRRWLLDRWASGFSELQPTEQINRLLQIDALGDIATETVAKRLVAEDKTVAATAYQLLRDHQSEWSTRDEASLSRAHSNLLTGLAAIAPELHGERLIWAKELVNQSLVEFVDKQTSDTAAAYELANQTLQLLSRGSVATKGSDSPEVTNDNSALVATDGTSNGMPQLVPLPVKLQDAVGLMPLEPVTEVASIPAATNAETIEPPVDAIQTASPLVVSPRITEVSPVEGSSVTQTPATGAAQNATEEVRESLQPVRMVTQNSLESYSTKSVIDLLGSKQTATRDDAVSELVRRGMSNEEIRIANQLASPILEVRLGLLESILHRQDIDPRPWLLWLAEDPSREVRLRAVSALGTMNDTAVTSALRERMTREHDATVSAKLARILSTQTR